MTVPFSAKTVVLDNGPGLWKTARVDIFEGNGRLPLLELQDMQHSAMFSRVTICESLMMCSHVGLAFGDRGSNVARQ
jgi:hypothetical protein